MMMMMMMSSVTGRAEHRRGEPLVRHHLSNAGVLQKCGMVQQMVVILDTAKHAWKR